MCNVQSYITSVDGNLKPIVEKLRGLLNSISENFTEGIKWNVPTYSINKNICSIMVHKKHVNLQIFRGAELEDAALLLGSGKGMRHLRFESLGDVEENIVRKLVKQGDSS